VVTYVLAITTVLAPVDPEPLLPAVVPLEEPVQFEDVEPQAMTATHRPIAALVTGRAR
jgi:hypothetical protein